MTTRKPRTKKVNKINPLYYSVGWFLLKVALVLAWTLFIYLIYLDSKITTLFCRSKMAGSGAALCQSAGVSARQACIASTVTR